MIRLGWGLVQAEVDDAALAGHAADVLVPTSASPALDLPAEIAALADDLAGDLTRRILVVVPDRTRPFPLRDVLPPFLEALLARGATPGRLTVAIASGTHLASETELSAAHLGALPRGVSVVRHDAGGPSAACGTTPAGTEVRVAPALLEADAVVALGGTAFHYFAGFGGGGKMLFPGLGARASVAANHRRSLGAWPPGGLAPGVEPGRLAGNPVAEDLAQAHALLPRARHLTLWPTAGGWAGARWRLPVEFASLCARYASGRRIGQAGAYDLVIASCGGAPRDLDVVQAHKGLFHAARYAKDGARVVFVSACEEGMGSMAIERWLAREDRETLEREARADYDLNAQTAISLAAIAARVRVTWAGRRPLPLLARWGFDVAPDARAACVEALAATARGARVAVLPAASEVLPLEPSPA